MKKFLLVLALFSISFIDAINSAEKRIVRLLQPYDEAVDFIINLDPLRQVNDHDVFVFFNKHGLYQKKDVRRFNSTFRVVKKLIYTKKSLYKNREKLELLIDNLEKVKNFIVDHAATYYALITYYEIAASYYYIDEQHDAVVNLIVQQSDKLGLPRMQGRGLYKFVKKIDLDLRRLTALFAQNTVSDDLILKMNAIKTKLVILKAKIVENPIYKSQLSKTRWLKAFGLLLSLIPICIAAGFFNAMLPGSLASSYLLALICAIPILFLTQAVVTMHELYESSRYNIPVHSNSLFSWFMPVFWPLTWIPRG